MKVGNCFGWVIFYLLEAKNDVIKPCELHYDSIIVTNKS
jgi:hypothetical protein